MEYNSTGPSYEAERCCCHWVFDFSAKRIQLHFVGYRDYYFPRQWKLIIRLFFLDCFVCLGSLPFLVHNSLLHNSGLFGLGVSLRPRSKTCFALAGGLPEIDIFFTARKVHARHLENLRQPPIQASPLARATPSRHNVEFSPRR
jgi:hypothetical protein